jgi:alpha-beta hydrolase superfamily lysophospholipase
MQSTTFTYKDQDGVEIFVYKWAPTGSPKAAIQIAHGLAEHAGRYERMAKTLTNAGFICYADDHRGHGKTAGEKEKLGVLGPGGWESTVKALKVLSDIIKKENPNIPLFFIGHSWGSLLGQDYIQQWSTSIKGVILSGTNGKQSFIVRLFGPILAKKEVKKIGADTPSPFLDKMTFGAFNKPYEPAATKFEWLSRDHAEVEKYVNDPLCGFFSTAGMAVELSYGVNKIALKENEAKISKDLPVYIMSGSADPSNNMAKGAQVLHDRYKKVWGIKDVSIKIYSGARHEIFNETNRDEVVQDVITWLNAHL